VEEEYDGVDFFSAAESADDLVESFATRLDVAASDLDLIGADFNDKE
jgi:hypothetical protein